jgi:DMSO/TMAO reductase YedYZ molybdopterin-dependent catalytic subunit
MGATGQAKLPRQDIDRRDFLARAALVSTGYAFAWRRGAAPAAGGKPRSGVGSAYPGLIIRQKEPANLEFPFPTLDSFITPKDRFYVRNHFAAPKLEAATWRLKVEGAVTRPLELGYEELRKLPVRTLTATLECAGNSRVFLVPKAKGVPWELGAVSNATWTGIPLAALLERAGLRDQAVEVILEGADTGEISEEPKSPGKIHFARSLPLAKARQESVLLAYLMNGTDLPAAHGFPLRAVVAGWYGMASIKWLTRIVVTQRPFQGYFQTFDYTIFERHAGLPVMVPVTEMEVKAEIARPVQDEVIAARTAYRIHGAAWTGESEVSKVEVSTDGGKTWTEARLLDRAIRYAWRLWEYEWQTPARPGLYAILARATDRRGRVQPLERDLDRRNYLVSHVLPTIVEVR